MGSSYTYEKLFYFSDKNVFVFLEIAMKLLDREKRNKSVYLLFIMQMRHKHEIVLVASK